MPNDCVAPSHNAASETGSPLPQQFKGVMAFLLHTEDGRRLVENFKTVLRRAGITEIDYCVDNSGSNCEGALLFTWASAALHTAMALPGLKLSWRFYAECGSKDKAICYYTKEVFDEVAASILGRVSCSAPTGQDVDCFADGAVAYGDKSPDERRRSLMIYASDYGFLPEFVEVAAKFSGKMLQAGAMVAGVNVRPTGGKVWEPPFPVEKINTFCGESVLTSLFKSVLRVVPDYSIESGASAEPSCPKVEPVANSTVAAEDGDDTATLEQLLITLDRLELRRFSVRHLKEIAVLKEALQSGSEATRQVSHALLSRILEETLFE